VSTRTVLLTPIDAWFFRDGRPYNQGESGQTDVRSLFPPFAPTVVGTLRAALALGQGWSGTESWADKLHSTLGNGFDDLGKLQFHGPFLVRNGNCLFPVPLHLLGRAADDATSAQPFWSPSAFLAPNLMGPVLESDLGPVRFPVPVRSNGQHGQLTEPSGLWITAVGYSRILRGEMPDAETLVPSSALWKTEQRVGLARNHDRRAAEEGALYSPEYVRLLRGVELATVVEGVPADWTFPDLIALGGESRMAQCESQADEFPLPQLPDDMIRQSNRFTVSLLSPLCLPKDSSGRLASPTPGQSFPGLTGSTVVSACVGRPVRIGGWNSLKREPLPLIPHLPAGSTWFCEAVPAALDSVLALHGRHVGERTPYGFGQIALGAWPQETGDPA
jgi:CRISPR-associated protein Cmr3